MTCLSGVSCSFLSYSWVVIFFQAPPSPLLLLSSNQLNQAGSPCCFHPEVYTPWPDHHISTPSSLNIFMITAHSGQLHYPCGVYHANSCLHESVLFCPPPGMFSAYPDPMYLLALLWVLLFCLFYFSIGGLGIFLRFLESTYNGWSIMSVLFFYCFLYIDLIALSVHVPVRITVLIHNTQMHF